MSAHRLCKKQRQRTSGQLPWAWAAEYITPCCAQLRAQSAIYTSSAKKRVTVVEGHGTRPLSAEKEPTVCTSRSTRHQGRRLPLRLWSVKKKGTARSSGASPLPRFNLKNRASSETQGSRRLASTVFSNWTAALATRQGSAIPHSLTRASLKLGGYLPGVLHGFEVGVGDRQPVDGRRGARSLVCADSEQHPLAAGSEGRAREIVRVLRVREREREREREQ